MNLQKLRNFAARVAGTALFSLVVSIASTAYTSQQINQLEALVHEHDKVAQSHIDSLLLENFELRTRVDTLNDSLIFNGLVMDNMCEVMNEYDCKLDSLTSKHDLELVCAQL